MRVEGHHKPIRVQKKQFKIDQQMTDQELWALVWEDACYICLSGDDEGNLLICDKCNYKVAHTYCLGFDEIPEEDWFCQACIEHLQERGIDPVEHL